MDGCRVRRLSSACSSRQLQKQEAPARDSFRAGPERFLPGSQQGQLGWDGFGGGLA